MTVLNLQSLTTTKDNKVFRCVKARGYSEISPTYLLWVYHSPLWWHLLIHIIVLEFFRGKEFHPAEVFYDSSLRKTSDEKHNMPPYTAHVVSTKCWLEMETLTMFLAKISTLTLTLELDSCGSRKFVQLVYVLPEPIFCSLDSSHVHVSSLTSSGNMTTRPNMNEPLTPDSG